MKVAVTGGAGFIGDAVRKELLRRNHQPVIIDRAHGVDVVDARKLEETMKATDAVIHLAGVLGTSELFQAPEAAITVNILGTINVLKVCAVGGQHYVGITMPQVWDNVYQVTKNAAMGLARAWHINFGVPVCHVRAYNVFGEHQKVGSPQKIIPTFATAAWNKEPIPVWGDGTQTVDLIYVDDVARILVDALAHGKDEIIDAGTGYQQYVLDVANEVWRIANPHEEPRIKFLPMRKGENERTRVGAAGEGWHLLDWRPDYRRKDLVRTVRTYCP